MRVLLRIAVALERIATALEKGNKVEVSLDGADLVTSIQRYRKGHPGAA